MLQNLHSKTKRSLVQYSLKSPTNLINIYANQELNNHSQIQKALKGLDLNNRGCSPR